MRPFEVLVLVLTLATLLASWPLKTRRPRILLGLWTGAMLTVVVQALLEKTRWQLVPAYLVLAFLSIAVFLGWKRRNDGPLPTKRRRWPQVLAFIVGLSTWGTAVLVATQLPVFSLPKPTGSYAIGVSSYEWLDEKRTDEHPQNPSGHRKIVVKVWYPASATGTQPEPYLDQVHAAGLANALKLPGFALGHLALVSTHSHRDVALAPGNERYPVVLFSHGYPLTADSATFAAEELASHGYVVFSINHTYDTAYVVFQDGTQSTVVTSGDVSKIDAVEKVLGPRLAVWVEDARFVLNEITKLDVTDSRFKGRLDLERVGYLGHSFGGATAYATLAADSRFKAAINMDGALFGVAQQAFPKQPFMLMNGDKIVVSDAQLAQTGAKREDVDAFLNRVETNWAASVAPAEGSRYRATVLGATHLGFSDVGLMVPAVAAGKTPVTNAHRVVNQYTRAFFDQHLKGQPSPVLSASRADSEVTFVVVPSK